MKNLKLTLTFSALFLFFFGPLTQAQEIIFNDATFKKSLVKNKKINTNGNSEIEIWEAMDYEGDINVSNRGILDLTGIEYFTSITKLNVSYNKLEKLDLGSNLALEEVYCNHNKIQKFDVSNLYELKVLQASNNRIATILLFRMYLNTKCINGTTRMRKRICPSSTPTLNASSEVIRFPPANCIVSASRKEKPKPCTSPNP